MLGDSDCEAEAVWFKDSRGIVETIRKVDTERRCEVNSLSVKAMGTQLCGKVLPEARCTERRGSLW